MESMSCFSVWNRLLKFTKSQARLKTREKDQNNEGKELAEEASLNFMSRLRNLSDNNHFVKL